VLQATSPHAQPGHHSVRENDALPGAAVEVVVVGASVGAAVVGAGVVGAGVETSVAAGVGAFVGTGVGAAVGIMVGSGVGGGVDPSMGSELPQPSGFHLDFSLQYDGPEPQ